MKRRQPRWALSIILAVACTRSTPRDAGRLSEAAIARTPLLPPIQHPAVVTQPDAAERAPSAGGFDPVIAALDAALNPTELRTLLDSLPSLDSESRTIALVALGRRTSAREVTALWPMQSSADRLALARGLTTRPVALGRVSFPTSWSTEDNSSALGLLLLTDEHAEATNLALQQRTLLAQAPGDAHYQALQLFRFHPNPGEQESAWIEALPPAELAFVLRQLTGRVRGGGALWLRLVDQLSTRARVLPRTWGNAWRAMLAALPYDALPPAGPEQILSMRGAADTSALSGEVGARWRCETLTALARWSRQREAIADCGGPAHPSITRQALPAVLQALRVPPDERVVRLRQLLAEAPDDVATQLAVLQALGDLTAEARLRLLTPLLATEDPGALAALLEFLVDHPELARRLSATTREALLRRPFARSEGLFLEARINALRLARLVAPALAPPLAGPTTVRAILLAQEQPLHPSLPALAPSTEAPTLTLLVETTAGTFHLRLRRATAPRAVEQLLRSVREHRYDGLRFHRVVPGFVAQGGDPRGDGYGGTENPVPTELSTRTFARGSVGIALAGLDTGGMQFFVLTGPAPHLDLRYPHVGEVTEGIEVVDALLPGDQLRRVELLETPTPPES